MKIDGKGSGQRNKDFIINYKESHPCHDCGNYFPHYVMEFDHRNPKKKKFGLSLQCVARKLELIKKEISKCDLVCANCHKSRSFKQKRYMPKHI